VKITLERNLLREALQIAAAGIPTNTVLPALNNIFFKATGSEIRLITTNLEVAVLSKIDFDTAEGIEVLLPPKFAPIVDSLSGDEVALDINLNGERGKVSITGGASKFDLAVQDTANYPEVAAHEAAGEVVTFTQKELKALLKQVIFCVSTDGSRPAFQGVLFKFNQDGLIVCSSDAFRLAYKKMEVGEGSERSLLVPGKSLKELVRLLSDETESVSVFSADSQVIFKTDKFTFAARVLNEKYPDISGVIPSSSKTTVVASTRELEEVVTRAALLAEGANHSIKLTLDDNGIDVGSASQIGQSTEIVALERKEGENVQLHINARFLLEGLKAVSGPKTRLCFNGANGPILIYDDEDEDESWFNLILPVRVG